LAQHTQGIESVLILRLRRPRLPDGPAELVSNIIKKTCNLGRRLRRLNAQEGVEQGTLVAVAEPCIADACGKKRNTDGYQQDEKVFLEHGPAPLYP